MTRPLVYVAGPITGDPWGCVRKAADVAAFLESGSNLHAYLPQLSVLHEMISPQPYEHWIEHGLAMVERCDGLWRIPGGSPGADREVAHAEALGLPVLFAPDDTDGHLAVPADDYFAWLDDVRHQREARR